MHPVLKQNENKKHLPVACFGELLLRFSPDADNQWIRNHSLPVYVGGAELNVASALALWGAHVEYITALPNNAVGKQLAEAVGTRGIANHRIIFTDGRMGLYYLPEGADLKNAGVIYDRNNSAFAGLTTGNLPWELISEKIGWLHITAISPALNENIAILCNEALHTAKAAGVITSIDLNYRAKLWQYGKLPVDIIPGIAAHADVIMGNVWAAETMLGIPVYLSQADTGDTARCIQQAEQTAATIFDKYTHCKIVANTFRFTEEEKVIYYAVLSTRQRTYFSKIFSAGATIDKAGSGDCFMGGLIFSLINNFDLQDSVHFAAAAAFGKLQVRGDNTSQTVEQIKFSLQ